MTAAPPATPSGALAPAHGYGRAKARVRALNRVLSLEDFEDAARRRLPRPIFGYVSGAAQDNVTRDANRRAFAQVALVPRALRDVSARSQETELFGRRWAVPFGIAPMGISALSAYRGDIVMARAAAAAGAPMVLSGSSLIPLEAVAEAAPGTWFQAYLPGAVARIDALIDRVAAAGCETLMITVDVPVAGNRENLVRAGFSTPLKPSLRLALDGALRPGWVAGVMLPTLLRHGMPHFENSFAERGAPILSRRVERDFSARDHFDWSHIAHIRRRWQGKLVLKGILHPDDAALAVEHGADGIVVSNHGGRQLDGALSPLHALPGVAARAGATPVMLDSGVRRGGDVLKALALGARFVFAGRPFLYAAAVAGEAGVAHAFDILRGEIDRDMALMGLRDLSELSPDLLRAADAPILPGA